MVIPRFTRAALLALWILFLSATNSRFLTSLDIIYPGRSLGVPPLVWLFLSFSGPCAGWSWDGGRKGRCAELISQLLQICEHLSGAGIDLCILVLQVNETQGKGDVLMDLSGEIKSCVSLSSTGTPAGIYTGRRPGALVRVALKENWQSCG